jgi:hypothetical protein
MDKDETILAIMRKLDLEITTNGLNTYTVLEELYDSAFDQGREYEAENQNG